jgi:hypothetical protein
MRLRQVARRQQQTGLVDSGTSAIMRHADVSTRMIYMRHVRRTGAATALSRPSRLQTRSRSRAVDDMRAASDPPGG